MSGALDDAPAFVLDSFALIAFMFQEPGAERVQRVLSAARGEHRRAWLSIMSLAEIAYIVERRRGLTATQAVLSAFQDLPLVVVEADRRTALAAAHVKAHHSMSLADAFVVALAVAKGGTILTGDPEFRSVEKLVAVEWLQRPPPAAGRAERRVESTNPHEEPVP